MLKNVSPSQLGYLVQYYQERKAHVASWELAQAEANLRHLKAYRNQLKRDLEFQNGHPPTGAGSYGVWLVACRTTDRVGCTELLRCPPVAVLRSPPPVPVVIVAGPLALPAQRVYGLNHRLRDARCRLLGVPYVPLARRSGWTCVPRVGRRQCWRGQHVARDGTQRGAVDGDDGVGEVGRSSYRG